jgi:hypothetical protein
MLVEPLAELRAVKLVGRMAEKSVESLAALMVVK